MKISVYSVCSVVSIFKTLPRFCPKPLVIVYQSWFDLGPLGIKQKNGYAQVSHPGGFDRYLDESLIVALVEKDVFGPSPPVHDMIPGVGVFGLVGGL